MLLTLLSAEVVGPRASSGPPDDQEWRGLVDAYHLAARKELTRFRGGEVEAGFGRFLASFDGPARAINCARAIADAAWSLGLEVRAGLHTGECELAGPRVQGLAVHIAGQVMACAAPGEVVVSNTVRDLVAGSGLRFEELRVRAHLGAFHQWSLYRVARDSQRATAATPATQHLHKAGFPRQVARLTPREQEVAALVARGLTNRQIAEALTIAEATAERHVINLLNKLGHHSRTQIAAWAVAQGLVPREGD